MMPGDAIRAGRQVYLDVSLGAGRLASRGWR
ncbi:MAG: hypothetical protein KatS3mg108_3713 [Isosphaeraceae bacterium]|nr:MAG: hypothetical protein KatS3mg108_3713 [Isosphaeraceae bacterium]